MSSAKKRVASRIPVGTQFTPRLFDLASFVRAVVTHSGDKNALRNAVWQPNVRLKHLKPSKRGRNLPLEAAAQYGLLEKGSWIATPLAKTLNELGSPKIYQEFAKHILLNCGGLRVLHGIAEMRADGLAVTGDTLSEYLSRQGFTVGEHNTQINSLRLWLAKAGVFPLDDRTKSWEVDETAKSELVGLDDEAILALASLTTEERQFVLALCKINPQGWYKAADVRDLVEATTDVRMTRSNAKEYLEPLRVAGIIEYRSGGTKGGKSAELRTTDKFDTEVLEVFVRKTIEDLDADVAAYYQKRPSDIYNDLDSSNKFRKGQALEAYAIHLMRLLGLRFVAWRRRSRETGAAEVDAVLEGVMGSTPTRWQIQCKNTPSGRVDVEDVSKEVGLIPITHATHVLVMANCGMTRDARIYASEVVASTPTTIFLLDYADFKEMRANSGRLGTILKRKALQIRREYPEGTLFGGTGKAKLA